MDLFGYELSQNQVPGKVRALLNLGPKGKSLWFDLDKESKDDDTLRAYLTEDTFIGGIAYLRVVSRKDEKAGVCGTEFVIHLGSGKISLNESGKLTENLISVAPDRKPYSLLGRLSEKNFLTDEERAHNPHDLELSELSEARFDQIGLRLVAIARRIEGNFPEEYRRVKDAIENGSMNFEGDRIEAVQLPHYLGHPILMLAYSKLLLDHTAPGTLSSDSIDTAKFEIIDQVFLNIIRGIYEYDDDGDIETRINDCVSDIDLRQLRRALESKYGEFVGSPPEEYDVIYSIVLYLATGDPDSLILDLGDEEIY